MKIFLQELVKSLPCQAGLSGLELRTICGQCESREEAQRIWEAKRKLEVAISASYVCELIFCVVGGVRTFNMTSTFLTNL